MDKRILVSISFLFVFISVPPAAAAVLYFDGPTGAVGTGDEFSVKVLIESEEPVNAYSLTIGYSDAALARIVSLSDAGSIADLKREPPQVTGPTSIKFMGASLKPFQGKGGLLFAINFKAFRPGLLELGVGGPKVYLADGKGTKIIPQAETFEILIGEGRESLVGGSIIEDKAPPEIEFLKLVDDPITPRQKLVSFLVKDDFSGVKEAVYRERRWLWWGSWKSAQNPTAIPLRTWSVEVKVFDNAGNAVSRIIYDWETFVKSNFVLWLILAFAVFTVANKRIKRKRL